MGQPLKPEFLSAETRAFSDAREGKREIPLNVLQLFLQRKSSAQPKHHLRKQQTSEFLDL